MGTDLRGRARRPGRLAAAALVLVAGACTAGDTPAPGTTGTPQPTPAQSPTVAQRAGWETCANATSGYTIDYPGDWSTNSEAIDHVEPCSLFDPQPERLRTEGLEVPADVAVALYVEAAPFHDVASADRHADELDRSEAVVDGREAVRTDSEATGEGFYPEGWRYTTWAVDLDGVTFVAQTFDVGELPYPDKQEVLDGMVASLRFDADLLAGCSAEGLEPPGPAGDVPEAVARTRADIAEAAVDCDYERLDELAGDDISYSFGEEGAFAAYLRRREVEGTEPLRYLVGLLDRPHASIEGQEGTEYVWPSAFAYEDWSQVPPEEREALEPLYGEDDFGRFEQFGGYIGYRVGIAEDGNWRYFVAGD